MASDANGMLSHKLAPEALQVGLGDGLPLLAAAAALLPVHGYVAVVAQGAKVVQVVGKGLFFGIVAALLYGHPVVHFGGGAYAALLLAALTQGLAAEFELA